ncbi:MAG: hypothetical protein QME66_08150 [Candidatus Eisenbacteria bacterium]|nr:hypothetical protein [Candidatus Eisenbacteria bacterium]
MQGNIKSAMKIQSVRYNNRRKSFEVKTSRQSFMFPYVKADPQPMSANLVADACVDDELGREGFSYVLKSGREGTVHIDQILEYNQDPSYMRNRLLYKLTLEAQKRVKSTSLSKREIIRRLGTSAAQFYRVLDPANYRKSTDQLLFLLHVLDCDVELVVRAKNA